MTKPSLFRAFSLALPAAATFAFVGCASSKMTSAPQSTTSTNTPTKEYEFHDMSSGKSFFGSPLSKNAQSQQSQPQ